MHSFWSVLMECNFDDFVFDCWRMCCSCAKRFSENITSSTMMIASLDRCRIGFIVGHSGLGNSYTWRRLLCTLPKIFVELGHHGNFLCLGESSLRALYEWRGSMKHEWRGTSNYTRSDRPLPTCKTSAVVTATIFTAPKTNIQRWRPAAATTIQVARTSAAPSLSWLPLYWL